MNSLAALEGFWISEESKSTCIPRATECFLFQNIGFSGYTKIWCKMFWIIVFCIFVIHVSVSIQIQIYRWLLASYSCFDSQKTRMKVACVQYCLLNIYHIHVHVSLCTEIKELDTGCKMIWVLGRTIKIKSTFINVIHVLNIDLMSPDSSFLFKEFLNESIS